MADDNPDTSNMFAGLKKKKKKTVQIADLELDGEQQQQTPAKETAKEAAEADPVRPLEASADLTLKEDEPLDFSDLKKVHFGPNSMPRSHLDNQNTFTDLVGRVIVYRKRRRRPSRSIWTMSTSRAMRTRPTTSQRQQRVQRWTRWVTPSSQTSLSQRQSSLVCLQLLRSADSLRGPCRKTDAAASGDVLEEFSGLKKKKKSKKSAFDLEAYVLRFRRQVLGTTLICLYRVLTASRRSLQLWKAVMRPLHQATRAQHPELAQTMRVLEMWTYPLRKAR